MLDLVYGINILELVGAITCPILFGLQNGKFLFPESQNVGFDSG
jgi:hypothetical protein